MIATDPARRYGLDFDYITKVPETATDGGRTVYLPYVFGVTAHGDADVIERSGEGDPEPSPSPQV